MIQEDDLNTDQEFSARAVDTELRSSFDYVVQNENMKYPPDNWIEVKTRFQQLFVLQLSLVDFQRSLNFCIFYLELDFH